MEDLSEVKFIGWSHDERQKRLQFVVINARLLILPWVKSRNLAYKLLAMVAKRVPEDWISVTDTDRSSWKHL